MQKYSTAAYFCCVWFAIELFAKETDGIIFALAYIAALTVFAVLKNRWFVLLMISAIIVGVSIYSLEFLFRIAPAVILLFGHWVVGTLPSKDNKKRKRFPAESDAGNYVYTAALLALGMSAAALIRDLSRWIVMIQMYRYNWTGFTVFSVLAVIAVAAIWEKPAKRCKTEHTKERLKLLRVMDIVAVICVFGTAALDFINPFLMEGKYLYFPWIIYIVMITALEDPFVFRIEECFTEKTASFLS